MWRDLNTKQLLAFRAVVDEGTFGRAGERLGFTQSAVSQQIASLEALVGHQLFDRPAGPNRPVLTPAGELLLVQADLILGAIVDAEREIDRFGRGVTGRLTISTFQSVSTRVLPKALRELYQEAPGLEVDFLADELQASRLEAILGGEADLAFLVLPSPEGLVDVGGLEVRYLGADPLVAVVPVDHPAGSVELADVSGAPLIGQPPHDACGHLIDEALERHGVTTNYAFRSHDNGAVQGMVAAGVGLAIAPLLTVDDRDPRISIRSIEPELEPRHLGLAWAADRTTSPLARRFIDHTVATCNELLSDAAV